MGLTYVTGKNVNTTFTSFVGNVEAEPRLLEYAFGKANIDTSKGDISDSRETRIWNIQFSDGVVARLSIDDTYGKPNYTVRVNGRSLAGLKYVQELLTLHRKRGYAEPQR